MRRFYRRRTKNKAIAFFIVLLVIAGAFYYIFSVRLMPLIKTIAVNNAKVIATDTINRATGKVLKDEQIDYDKLMTIEKDSSGEITAVKADTLKIDQLKYEITNEAIKEINEIDPDQLSVPIGTVIGGQLLSGKGPRVKVKIEPIGSVETKIVNEFTSTGINQTRQQILLNVTASITIMVSSYSVTTDVTSNFTLADTVIVGSVPDSYMVVDDGSSAASGAEKVFIYGKNQSSQTK